MSSKLGKPIIKSSLGNVVKVIERSLKITPDTPLMELRSSRTVSSVASTPPQREAEWSLAPRLSQPRLHLPSSHPKSRPLRPWCCWMYLIFRASRLKIAGDLKIDLAGTSRRSMRDRCTIMIDANTDEPDLTHQQPSN